MLVSFSLSYLLIFSAVYVKFWEVPVSNLIRSSRCKYDNVIIIIWVRLLLFEVLLSFFWVHIKSKFLVIIVAYPSFWFDFRMYFFDKLLCFFECNIRLFMIWRSFLLCYLLFSQYYSFLWNNILMFRWGWSVFLFLWGFISFQHRRLNCPFSFIICYIDFKPILIFCIF